MRRRLIILGVAIAAVIAFLYVGLPRLAGLEDTWQRAKDGEPGWLVAAALLEVASFASYVVLFRAMFRRDWRDSYLITLAGVAATRLFASAGAGGIALTAWALRRSGIPRRDVAVGLTAFMVLLYAIFFGAMLLVGIGLRTDVLPGSSPWGVTVVPAAFAGVVMAVAIAAAYLPADLGTRWGETPSWAGFLRHVGSAVSAVGAGVRDAFRTVRSGRPGLLGAPGWWLFDIATLWASFHAFGEAPSWAVIVMGYVVGQLGNTLPLPGGVGGVEGGMIGSFIAFGVSGGLALVAVLTYRAFAFWLPTVPGGIAYLQLTRRLRSADGSLDGGPPDDRL